MWLLRNSCLSTRFALEEQFGEIGVISGDFGWWWTGGGPSFFRAELSGAEPESGIQYVTECVTYWRDGRVNIARQTPNWSPSI